MSGEPVRVVWASRVHTLDRTRPRAECIAVDAGRVALTGSVEEVRGALLGREAEWLDLRPGILVPGFSDSHIHLTEWGLGIGRPDLSRAGSLREALVHVREVARAAEPGAWLEINGWDPAWHAAAEPAELDEAAAGRAVALIAHDLHSGWLSTEALRRLAIGPEREDPPGGEVERDGAGRPTGVLKERALDWWYQGRPQPGDAERRAAVLGAQAQLHRLGVTALHSVEAPVAFAAVERLARTGELRLRVLHHFPQRFLDSLIECRIPSGYGDDWLRVGGIKYFTDGALGSTTAWMLEPYEGSRQRGIRRLAPDELRHDVVRAHAAGLAATVHAIGDAAVRMTLDALEAAGSGGVAIPHRIEHLQCVHPDDLGRAARAGVVASMQPSHLLTDIKLVEERWGPRRARGAFALRSLLEAGTLLAFGSDAPVEAADPREGFFAARARRDRSGYPAGGWFREERLTGQEVLTAYTLGPARAAGDAERRGWLGRGCHADFAVWDRDLTEVAPEEVLEAAVLATFVGGEVVYES